MANKHSIESCKSLLLYTELESGSSHCSENLVLLTVSISTYLCSISHFSFIVL